MKKLLALLLLAVLVFCLVGCDESTETTGNDRSTHSYSSPATKPTSAPKSTEAPSKKGTGLYFDWWEFDITVGTPVMTDDDGTGVYFDWWNGDFSIGSPL